MAVTRCVCFTRSFTAIKTLATQHGWTRVAQVTAALGCGSGCGGCRPYLAEVLRTGHTCFAVRTGDAPPQPCAPEPWDTPGN